MSDNTLYFSPSQHHRHLRSQIEPELTFRGDDLTSWQAQLRARIWSLLGDMPDVDSPPPVRSLWKREVELGTIEKLVMRSEPFSDVPAYLCIPHNVSPPYPLMLCLQGHSTGMHNSIGVDREDEALPIEVEGDRDFGISSMRYGFAALCIEQRAFGERREQEQERIAANGCHDAAMHALMLGRTLLGERIFDVRRAIDYLATRDDIDMGKVGVMGNSGGGTVSLFSAALLPRISFAMPSCYFCTFEASIMSIYHCACNYLPRLLQVAEMADVMGLFAPKPVVLVSGQEDEIFPIGATRSAFEHLKQIYRAAGAEERCRLVEGVGGHRFYAQQAWPVLLDLLAEND